MQCSTIKQLLNSVFAVMSRIIKVIFPGTPELGGGAGGAAAPAALYQEGQGGQRCPLIQFKGLPWRNTELSEMLMQIFYEFASENARNAVIELQG
jgi:hypothetical protein